VVASNGAVTFSYPPMKVISEVTFDAREAVNAVLQHVPEAAVAIEEHGVGYRVNRHFPEGELDGEMILTSVEEMMATEVSRVIIRDPGSTSEDFVALAERLGLQGTNYFIGWTAWLDLAPEGVSKASGLAEVAARLGVAPEHVLAIGDGRNDIEMLQWAGRGVAMGQAPDEVKAAADAVTASVEEDGAALEILRWV
jgi:HAD superfamily hydrolase (TIGR01484 family)